MNIAEYIASGILEQYVSGSASLQEMQEVECMSHIYPEISRELVSMQNALEALAMSEAKTPPAFLRTQIFDAIRKIDDNVSSPQEEFSEPHVVEMNLTNTESNTQSKRFFNLSYDQLKIAASVLFLLSAGVGVFSVYQSNKLSQEVASIKNEFNTQQKILSAKNEQLAIVSNLNFKPVVLKGIETKSPESAATIYWNKSTKDVYIAVANLPKPAEDKQYQLWAIADGKPVDMGMIDTTHIQDAFQKMKTISNAQAFAITLEKKGGVPSPTLTEMYVMGGV